MPLLNPDNPDPEALGKVPESIRQMFAYWQRKRGARRMPSRADIDPAEMKAMLPFMILVDVVYDAAGKADFVYRLVGTREVEIRNGDPTGQRVAEAFHGPSAENALGCYRQAVESRMPYLDDEYFAQADDRFGDEANLFLPLSNDDETVNMVLVFTAYRKLK
ncbi:MAG TPA: PAS domain-containing protein [Alphaproteobacteria bacterium]|nr:PAS domain-containing protein [Alphaproteobacteria bacterium]